jgi:hypothetical protein
MPSHYFVTELQTIALMRNFIFSEKIDIVREKNQESGAEFKCEET